MQLSPFPCHLVPLRSKYAPQHPILKHPQPAFLPQCQRPGFTPIQNHRQNYSSIYLHWLQQINYDKGYGLWSTCELTVLQTCVCIAGITCQSWLNAPKFPQHTFQSITQVQLNQMSLLHLHAICGTETLLHPAMWICMLYITRVRQIQALAMLWCTWYWHKTSTVRNCWAQVKMHWKKQCKQVAEHFNVIL